jgi:hypothetical protein
MFNSVFPKVLIKGDVVVKRFAKTLIVLTAFFLLIPSALQAQVRIVQQPQTAPVVVAPSQEMESSEEPAKVSRSDLSKELVKAAVACQRRGEITRLELLRLRVAMLSPAFRAKAEDLAVIQIAASGQDGPFSVDENGEIVRETIDWEGLGAFLEKLIPLILMLIKAFGG